MKKMTVLLFVVLILIAIFPITGCERSIEIIGIEWEKYPDNLIYIQNVDNRISLEGHKIRTITRGGVYIDEFRISKEDYENIDFSKTGVQIVTLNFRRGQEDEWPVDNPEDFIIEFPIQIISQEQAIEYGLMSVAQK